MKYGSKVWTDGGVSADTGHQNTVRNAMKEMEDTQGKSSNRLPRVARESELDRTVP